MGPKTVADAEGVSSVVGTVLMLAITMSIFAGFSYLVLEDLSESQAKLRTDVGVVQDGGAYLLQHRGGDAMALADGLLLLTVDGAEEELSMAEFAAQTTDGSTWRIGEALCVSGPGPPCLYEDATVTRLVLVHGNSIVVSDAPVAADPPVLTYVGTHAVSRGTVASFAAAQSASDAGAEAELEEAGTAVPAGTTGPVRLSGTPLTSGGATDPTFVQSSDGSSAELDAIGESVEVSGFTLPANAATVTSLQIGYEGRKSATGGVDPTTRLDFRIGSGSYDLGTSITEGATADTDRTRTVTGLDPDDVRDMAVRVYLVDDTNRNPLIDHVFIVVTYTTTATTTYDLSVDLAFADVPDDEPGAEHTLQLRYRASGESFRVQVYDNDAAAYVTQGVPLGASTSTVWQYALSPEEMEAGVVRLRLIDADVSGVTQGTLWLGYVRVVTA